MTTDYRHAKYIQTATGHNACAFYSVLLNQRLHKMLLVRHSLPLHGVPFHAWHQQLMSIIHALASLTS